MKAIQKIHKKEKFSFLLPQLRITRTGEYIKETAFLRWPTTARFANSLNKID